MLSEYSSDHLVWVHERQLLNEWENERKDRPANPAPLLPRDFAFHIPHTLRTTPGWGHPAVSENKSYPLHTSLKCVSYGSLWVHALAIWAFPYNELFSVASTPLAYITWTHNVIFLFIYVSHTGWSAGHKEFQPYTTKIKRKRCSEHGHWGNGQQHEKKGTTMEVKKKHKWETTPVHLQGYFLASRSLLLPETRWPRDQVSVISLCTKLQRPLGKRLLNCMLTHLPPYL